MAQTNVGADNGEDEQDNRKTKCPNDRNPRISASKGGVRWWDYSRVNTWAPSREREMKLA